MSDITLVSQLKSMQSIPTSSTQRLATGFSQLFNDAIARTDQLQKSADTAAVNLQTGASGNIHETMIAVEQADISLRMLVQMRNRIVEAYQEIMRMQI